MTKKTKNSIIKDSSILRKALKQRLIEELKMDLAEIVDDAKDKGASFTKSSLSKHLNHGNIPGSLSEENIVWLSIRWGIPIQLQVGKLVFVNKGKRGVRNVIPPYNEEKSLEMLNQIFRHETTMAGVKESEVE